MNPQQPNDSELLLSVTEKLDEYNFLPGLTHEEDCGYWGTEDGEGEDYCDCEYKKEVGLWKDCRAELAALIQDEILKARIEEVEPFTDKRITMIETLYRYADKRMGELSSQLKTKENNHG